ncbi:MAG: permease, partial [Dehalococcoidia bacterium]
SRQVSHRIKHVLRYAFVDMLRDIGPWLLLGIVLAAVVAVVAPVGDFVGTHLGGVFGYLFGLGFGLIMYICSTGSVPLVHALLSQGMNVGAGMLILLVGPVTSWGTILVMRREFGARILAIFLLVVSSMSVLLGYVFSLL